jgi:antitoxin FitA
LIGLGEQPDPQEFWDRVRHRLLATGTRLPADVILEARDADRP